MHQDCDAPEKRPACNSQVLAAQSRMDDRELEEVCPQSDSPNMPGPRFAPHVPLNRKGTGHFSRSASQAAQTQCRKMNKAANLFTSSKMLLGCSHAS